LAAREGVKLARPMLGEAARDEFFSRRIEGDEQRKRALMSS